MRRRTNSKKTTFIYMGDLQCDRFCGRRLDYSGFGELLSLSRRKTGDEDVLVVLSGDIVNRADNEEEWKLFFEAAGPIRNFVTAEGNPRRRCAFGEIDSFLRYSGAGGTLLNTPGKTFFSFDYGDIHFTFLDSNVMCAGDECSDREIKRWLSEDLSESSAPVGIAVMHHPVFPVFYDRKEDERYRRMKEEYAGILTEHGVDFLLCGHQHCYCRFRDRDGLTQLMSVTGTKYFPVWEESDDMEKYIEFSSLATVFETDGESICMKTFDLKGGILDCFEKPVNKKFRKKS